MTKFLGGLSGVLLLSNGILFLVMRYRLRKAKRAIKDRNDKIAELNGFITQRDSAITALEDDLATERDAAAGAIQEIRELRDDVSACREPSAVLNRFERLLETLQKAPESSDNG